MKKLIYITGILLLFLSVNTFGQLSDRVNNPSTLKVGTRPVQGNMGIYFGISYRDIKDWVETEEYEYTGIPLVSFKYYVTDTWVGRLGINSSKKSKVEEGEIDPLVDGSFLVERRFNEVESKFIITPGFEYHFTNSNLLDVYAGALIPWGWTKEEYITDSRYTTGEYNYSTVTKRSYAYGYEFFIGLQAFIADLPLAIGFDMGVAGLGYFKDKYKHVNNVSVGGLTTDQTFYTVDKDAGFKYRDLTSKNFELEGNIRVTLSYFFGR